MEKIQNKKKRERRVRRERREIYIITKERREHII